MSGRARGALAGGLLAVALAPTTASAVEPELAVRSPQSRHRLSVSGNLVFSPNVYEAVVGLSPSTPLTPRIARRVENEILRFLRASGYELARVAARIDANEIDVVVDEGQLRRIVFPGQDAMRAIGMTLALDLKEEVFNRPDLEAKLPELERQFGVTITGYRLIPVEGEDPGRDFGIPGLPGFKALSEWLQVPTSGGWELHIDAEADELPPGWGLDADFEGPDGLTAKVSYRWKSVLLEDDRFEISPELGLRVQDLVEDGEGRRFWSRVGGGFRWTSPPFGAARVRPFIYPRALAISRQRRDIDIRVYDYLDFEPIAGVRIPFSDALVLDLGVGLQYRNLFLVDVESENEPPPRSNPTNESRLVVAAGLKLRFGGSRIEVDREHRIDVRGRAYTLVGEQDLYFLSARYDKSFAIGYDDFIIESWGVTMFGDVTFTDEVRIADHLRGLFGDEFFTDNVVSLKLEYRYAIVQNVVKLAVFHDAALFRGVDRDTGREFPRVANAFGPGLTAVVFQGFEAAVYGVFGFMSEGPSDITLSLSLRQLF